MAAVRGSRAAALSGSTSAAVCPEAPILDLPRLAVRVVHDLTAVAPEDVSTVHGYGDTRS
jgi:hypothetical protein